jgi:hypothetical protein
VAALIRIMAGKQAVAAAQIAPLRDVQDQMLQTTAEGGF